MIQKDYELKGDIYSVVACTKEDIPSHIERVILYWELTNTHLPTQQKLMEECIRNDTAYKVVDKDNNCKAVIYLKKTKVDEADCYYMWFENKRMLAILFYYIRMTVNLRLFRFTPHDKQHIPFKFLLPPTGIKLFQMNGTPIEISVYSNSGQILYEDHFLRYNIKEL